MDFGIAGKTALVLGASRGLGRASAEALAAEGVRVLAASRSGTGGQLPGIELVTADLSDPDSVSALIASVLERGGVDILVNNTGGPRPGRAAALAAQNWRDTFATLALPLLEITAKLLPGMIERKWGRIVTVGSSGVVQPIPNLALSNGVRGAIAGWSKTLAAEVAAHGVTVNMVLPGRIDTDRLREIDTANANSSGSDIAAVQKQSIADIPAGRYGRAEEFGAVVAFLASQQASYITGSMVAVDGGAIKGLH